MTMKKILIPTMCALVLTVGCGKKQTSPTANANPAPDDNSPSAPGKLAQPLPAPKPSVPSTTSFAAVTKHLDAGGDFYLYWNAQQIQSFAQNGLEKIEKMVKAEMPPEMRDEADQYMKLAKAAYIESGLESIDGFGASSFRSGTGLRRHKVMIHRDPAKGDGLMWQALGTAPHELGGLKLMPATTAYAVHADVDVAGTFKWIKGFIASNLPAKQGAMLIELLEEANAEVPIEKIINSTGGEVGMYVTLNPNKIVEMDPRMLDIGGGPEPWEMEGDAEEESLEDEAAPRAIEEGVHPENIEGFDPSNGDDLPPTKEGEANPLHNGRRLEQLPPQAERALRAGSGDDPFASELVADPGPGFQRGPGGFVPGKRDMPKIKLPEPGLVLVLKVQDNTIPELLAPLLKEAGATAQQVEGVTMHSVPIPVPAEELPIAVSPTFFQVGEYLVITSTTELARQVVAVHSGKDAGLAGTAEFKKLTNGLDLKANMITYMSSQVGEAYKAIMNAALRVPPPSQLFRGAPLTPIDIFAEMNTFLLESQVSLLSVTDEGYLIQNQTTGHIPMDMNIALAISAVPTAVIAAAATPTILPALAKAKAKANRIKSINNMRQISNAIHAYINDNEGELPPADKWCDAILPYVGSPLIFISPQDPEAMAKFERGEKVSSYALNAALGGVNEGDVFGDGNLVLVFECNLGWNGSGGLADLRKHVPPDQWNISTFDGWGRQTNPNQMQRDRIKWRPGNDR